MEHPVCSQGCCGSASCDPRRGRFPWRPRLRVCVPAEPDRRSDKSRWIGWSLLGTLAPDRNGARPCCLWSGSRLRSSRRISIVRPRVGTHPRFLGSTTGVWGDLLD